MRLPSNKWIIGIDEAGRGPLAGPVVVAGVRIEARSTKHELRVLRNICDSKKLSPKQREEWFRVLTTHPYVKWAAARVSPKMIDRINIARAANLGARRVYKKLTADKVSSRLRSKNKNASGEPCRTIVRVYRELPCQAFLDGNLYLPSGIPHETIIKGDEKIPVIAAASIIAKVIRDRLMTRLHKKYPQYGFERHKGYGTRLHRELITTYGLSKIHRLSFCRRIQNYSN